jgi:hypothetical protein
MGLVCERYHILFENPNRQKKWVTVQSVQCHVAGWLYRPYGRTADMAASGEDMWQVMWHMVGKLDQSEGDTCHHCKGDTWHGMTSAG